MNGDCLELMKEIPDNSVDMILCDLPYSHTHNEWDSIIPFEPLWEQYNRIIKDNGAIVLFSQTDFTGKLMISNLKYFRYTLVWDKVRTTGFLNANKMPLRQHEDILVFYKKLPIYNPQMVEGGEPSHSRGKKWEDKGSVQDSGKIYGKYNHVNNSPSTQTNMKYPTSILRFSNIVNKDRFHPTQKPVELLEWLIKTYTNEDCLVLDNCMGSGSTGVACVNTGRNFIGIELDKKYFEIAQNRIEEAAKL
jgi:site-specific DNA-methyltransferase (adenine-specific)